MITAHREGDPLGYVGGDVLDDVDGEFEAGFGREDLSASSDVLLEHIVLDEDAKSVRVDLALFSECDKHRCPDVTDRISGGAYLPDANDATYYIEVYPYDVNHFELNARGLELDIYQDIKLQKNLLSNFKTKMGLPYIMAALAAKAQGLDDLFLTDLRGQILETSSCNLFIISNGVLYTPGLDEGCLAGTMRMQVINLALANGIKVYECAIMPQNLLAADEVFLTNAIRGINWVGGYRTKRYQNNISRKLVVLLNAYWEKATQ